ncbi:hypothetical protein Glove_615g4 [Diversispora epigaea]|uniref:Cns1/TTC4 wheel domain-containing protein n=1 Tax=Diversispora epigaea TaxID=1348612 RepID=A0A397G6C9_9GLOM|nr:hypothetical protein Glove_615g4 [Diversispora epigaea]
MSIFPEPPKPKNVNEEFLKEWNKVPLFMTELPEEEEESETLAALQSLMYEGSPEEIADNFKNQGNDCFKNKKYQDAIIYYTKALEESKCQDNKILEDCLTNRAAVNLELQNYRKVLTDCAKVIKSNPKNIKAYYRSAKALYELNKIDEAIDCCDHGIKIGSNNTALLKFKESCIKKKEILDTKIRLKKERELKEREEKDALEKALKSRKIKMEITNNIDNNNSSVHLNSENQLIWPVVFLYPEYKQSDFITEFNEENTFQDHLEIMFGDNSAPWDVSKKYINIDKLEIYYEYNLEGGGGGEGAPRLLKINKNCNLRKVLSHPKYIVKNGIPSFFILSDLSGEFKNKFLANYK